MPVVYQIDGDRKIIRTRCIDPLTVEEVLEHFRTLERDSNCPERLDVLLDVSEATSVPLSENLRQVTREIGRVRSRVQFGTCAIVASKDALFGMMRMFEVFAGNYFRETRVFRVLAEAEAWLASQTNKSSSNTHGASTSSLV
jgi:hypothetical protein